MAYELDTCCLGLKCMIVIAHDLERANGVSVPCIVWEVVKVLLDTSFHESECILQLLSCSFKE